MGIPHLAKNERDMGHPSVVACCRLSWTRRWIFTNLSVQIDDGYLTSRKKRARYGAPECCCMLQAELDAEVDLYGSFRADRRWVSHISQKTSEIWGTRVLLHAAG